MRNDPGWRNEYRPWTAGHGETRHTARPSLTARIVGKVAHPRALAWTGTAMVLAAAVRGALT